MRYFKMASLGGEIMPTDSNSNRAEKGALNMEPLSAELKETARTLMLDRLATTSAHFAHQQRDAPDLTKQEKIDIAAEILQKNPAIFLARFGKFLQTSDLIFFQDVDEENYEIQFHLKEIRHRCSHLEVIVKNRRYSAMEELEQGGVYFSEEEMKRREPLLYEQMIGQFMTDDERQQMDMNTMDRSDLRFSTVLMKHIDDAQERELYRRQKDREDCQEEEEEEEEDSEEEEADDETQSEQRHNKNTAMEEEEEDEEDIPEISDVRVNDIWRQQMREEFKAIMHEKFLSGDDTQFDYSKVDDNPDYDSLVAVEQDEQNEYFLAELPETVKKGGSDSGSTEDASSQMEVADKEEEDDYMMYEPPPDLVQKSAQFVKTGTWTEKNDCVD